MAEGGDVSFCSKEQKHMQGCQYYAEGGEVPAFDDIPDSAPEQEGPPPFDEIPVADQNGPPPFDELPDETAAPVAEQGGEGASLSLPESLPDAAQRAMGAGIFRTPKEEPEESRKITDEELQKAAEQAEDIAGMASLVTGGGAVGLAGKAATKLAQYTLLGRKGAAALKTAAELEVIHASNDISKALLGQGRPEDAVNPFLAHGATLLFGSIAGAAGAKLSEVVANKVATNAQKFLAGIGLASDGTPLQKGADEAVKAGHELFQEIAAGRTAEHAGSIIGSGVGGLPGKFIGQAIGRKILKPLLGKGVGKVSAYVAPTVLRWLQNGAKSPLLNMIDYADKVAAGESLVNNSIEALFKGGALYIPEALEDDINKLRGYSDENQLNQDLKDEMSAQHEDPQFFAEGGQVKGEGKKSALHDQHVHIADNMPEQNLMIQTARGRVAGYLSAQRPQQHTAKLAFDDEPDDREQKKSYEKALRVAAHPVGILSHIKEGTIDHEDMIHMHALYPELTGHLQKKVTERIVKDQMEGKKPSYKVRQGLSLFMGAPLSGELTPQNIQAAQSVFTDAKQQQQPARGKSSGGPRTKAPLSKSDRAYLTDDQAREARQQRG